MGLRVHPESPEKEPHIYRAPVRKFLKVSPGALPFEPARRTAYHWEMRYVVKNKETGRFLSSSGEWTPLLGRAQKFPNGLSVNLHLENAALPLTNELQIVQLPAME